LGTMCNSLITITSTIITVHLEMMIMTMIVEDQVRDYNHYDH